MWVWIFSDVFLLLCNLNLPTVSSATFNFSHISAGLIRLHKMTFGNGDYINVLNGVLRDDNEDGDDVIDENKTIVDVQFGVKILRLD